jgi:hypothetical protein
MQGPQGASYMFCVMGRLLKPEKGILKRSKKFTRFLDENLPQSVFLILRHRNLLAASGSCSALTALHLSRVAGIHSDPLYIPASEAGYQKQALKQQWHPQLFLPAEGNSYAAY